MSQPVVAIKLGLSWDVKLVARLCQFNSSLDTTNRLDGLIRDSIVIKYLSLSPFSRVGEKSEEKK